MTKSVGIIRTIYLQLSFKRVARKKPQANEDGQTVMFISEIYVKYITSKSIYLKFNINEGSRHHIEDLLSRNHVVHGSPPQPYSWC
jgi:hypothetical protein